jgi:N-methylhydantoinase B
MVVETAEPAVGNTAGDGVRYGACGILGGKDGAPHRYILHSEGRPPRAIKTKEVGLVIHPNDVLVLESGGGGGWGDAAERDPAAVASDIENGFVTAAAGDAHNLVLYTLGEGVPATNLQAQSPPPQAGEG